MEGVPIPEPTAKLRFVRVIDGHFEPASVLRHGDEFFIEAAYETAPSKPPTKITLSGTEGGQREIDVEQAKDDPVVFRSVKRMRLEPPATRNN